MPENPPTPTPHIYIFLNPVAGTSDPLVVRAILENRLDQQGFRYQIYETTGQENIRTLVKEALKQGFNIVWAAGGDGTVSGVTNGLVNTDNPMGIIPTGTGNALARELGIPLDVAAACDLLLSEHQTKQLDILEVEGAYFVLSVSVGISAMTMVETERSIKRRFGRMAYILNGIRIFLSNSLWPFRVWIDGQPGIVRASELIAANAGIIGIKPIRWGSQVCPDDGVIDLCYARVGSVTDLFALLGGLLLNRQDQVKEVNCQAAQNSIVIRSRRRMPVQGDGEDFGFTPVQINIIPGGLSVIVPNPPD